MFKWFKKILYALPFGLKAADSEILSSGEISDGNDSTIEKKVSQNSLMDALLRGEVTKEVEEFRYSSYKIGEKANEYKYVGNGQAVKKEIKKNKNDVRFTQYNQPVVTSVLEDLKHVGDYGKLEQYFINLEYKEFSRFRICAFITQVDVEIKNEKAKTKVHFNILPDPYNAASAPFINELRKIKYAKDSEYALNRNEIANRISTLSFVTFKATNDEPDLISYAFYNPKFIDYQETESSAYIEYEWEGYIKDNLTDKFYSKSQDEKYKNKEKKDGKVEFINAQNDVKEIDDLTVLKSMKNKFIEITEKDDKSSD